MNFFPIKDQNAKSSELVTACAWDGWMVPNMRTSPWCLSHLTSVLCVRRSARLDKNETNALLYLCLPLISTPAWLRCVGPIHPHTVPVPSASWTGGASISHSSLSPTPPATYHIGGLFLQLIIGDGFGWRLGLVYSLLWVVDLISAKVTTSYARCTTTVQLHMLPRHSRTIYLS